MLKSLTRHDVAFRLYGIDGEDRRTMEQPLDRLVAELDLAADNPEEAA